VTLWQDRNAQMYIILTLVFTNKLVQEQINLLSLPSLSVLHLLCLCYILMQPSKIFKNYFYPCHETVVGYHQCKITVSVWWYHYIISE